MSDAYDYLVISLASGRPAWTAFADHAAGSGRAALEREGGALVGLFSPQLGFAANEAAALVRWPGGKRGDLSALTGAGQVTQARIDALTPTARPADGAAPVGGGIYVHRWFVIDEGDLAPFVDISARAWVDFEAAYDARIFGLFAAERTAADLASGHRRVLLVTRYGSHGVWENSREQTNDPDGLFVRRQQMIRATIGRSCLLV